MRKGLETAKGNLRTGRVVSLARYGGVGIKGRELYDQKGHDRGIHRLHRIWENDDGGHYTWTADARKRGGDGG